MSFRSAWRHSARLSPSTAHVIPKAESITSSEPTLVVTNSRPASAHDPKSEGKGDKPVETPAQPQETVEQPAETSGVVTATETSVDTAPGAGSDESKAAEPKDLAPAKEGPTAQEARWFPWWSGSSSEPPTALEAPEAKKSRDSERPNTATELTTTTVADKVNTTSPTAAPPTVPTTSPTEPTPPPTSSPTQPLGIKAAPTTSEFSNGSYLAWIWPSSRSPPKPDHVSDPNSDHTSPSDTTTATNGHVTKPAEPQDQKPALKSTEASVSTIQNPLITTLPQTRSSWMSFWARSESMSDLERNNEPETMQVPENIDPQGRPVKKQKTQDDKSLVVPPPETNGSIKSKKPTHTPSTSITSLPGTPTKPPPATPATPVKSDTATKTPQKGKNGKDKIKQPPPPNHVLPEFQTVYPSLPPKETFLTRVTKRILPASGNIAPGAIHSHPKRCSPPPIRKAVAIGIHGFFPLRIIRNILGEPTGTSVKFASLASEAIHRYAAAQYGSGSAVEVVKIALEGEGTVSARIDMLWRNLRGKDEWMDHIREADLILVACHSQGSPVGAGIVAKLVEEGIVNDRTRLGLLCVAGIHLGPATDVGQRVVIKAYNAIESEAARELYDFQDSDSKVARKYVEALRTILAHDTRVTFIGSIDDHLVPMYSSTFSTAYHGAIYRAVFIDGRIHQNDFLARLVAFALRLRNEGWRDHGVMTELSSALMGNFYTGEGHSRIYDEPAVYDLALRNTLETTSMKHMPLHIEPFKARTNPNPYLLPWSMRGVLEETIRGPLSHELEELKEEFAKWDPKGPKLKDLKWRMEGWSNSVKPKI